MHHIKPRLGFPNQLIEPSSPLACILSGDKCKHLRIVRKRLAHVLIVPVPTCLKLQHRLPAIPDVKHSAHHARVQRFCLPTTFTGGLKVPCAVRGATLASPVLYARVVTRSLLLACITRLIWGVVKRFEALAPQGRVQCAWGLVIDDNSVAHSNDRRSGMHLVVLTNSVNEK